ncbi:MAG: bifunctional phosphopantothenoylcysteine decarboxylase/phosphopantothenate--cysteine ligase CoaBC [Bacteroidota bacterium]
MALLLGRKILLGITGSIAAYKSATLVRLLIKAGAEVKVLMTPAATEFITPLTIATLSKNEVHADLATDASWNNHVELGMWADVMLIAPLTATTLAKMTNGFCDNLLTATYLSAKCPVLVAPAMDLDMWKHPSTQNNITQIKTYGNQVIPVGYGELASGLVGAGRMAEPEEIINYLADFFNTKKELLGKKAIVTAGPTYEPIDPVRFIGNRSSGKMGIAIAEALAAKGAEVELILGPTHFSTQVANIQTTKVQTAQEMYKAAIQSFSDCQIAILAAAVADYRPETVAHQKIKKKEGGLTIPLARTKDIAATLGQRKEKNQVIVGFALETNNELENAQSKLIKKNFDLIVLNSLQDKGAGFQHDTNKVTIISAAEVKNFPLKRKIEVAEDIVDELVLRFF